MELVEGDPEFVKVFFRAAGLIEPRKGITEPASN